jgi:hypothetical protein
MTLTAMNEASEAPAAAGLGALTGPVSGRQAERLQAQLVAAQVKRQDRAAEDERRRQDQAAADRRRQENLAAEDERRKRRQKERDDRRADRRRERTEALSGAGKWMSGHKDAFAFAPVVLVPALLSWSAMSNFGIALFGTNGHALPVLSEVGMWIFEAKITGARAKGDRVWNYYAGMAFCAAVCAALNYLHGDLGPIPGSVKPSVLTGVAYALIAVSGIIIHQLATVGGHAEDGAETPVTDEVAPHDEDADPATNAPAARHLTGPLGRQLLPVAAVSGAPADPDGGGATKDDLDRATADLDRAVAARRRAERENAELRQQLADALRGDSEKDSSGSGAEKPAKRGDKQTMMRAHWEAEIATGNIPNGADLNRAAGNDPGASLGRRYASEWRDELPSEFTGQITGDQQEETTQEESTSTVLAGAA